MKQQELNTFIRTYFDLTKIKHKNVICHDSNVSREHRFLVVSICEWLRDNEITFYTRVYTKWGEIVDIVAPGLPKPFIEVRHSEKDKYKEYEPQYDSLRVFIDCDNPFKLM